MKLQFKLFLNWLIYYIHLIILFIIAYNFNKLWQMIFFECLFNFIQGTFRYRFHSDSIIEDPIKATRWCRIITCCVEISYLIICCSLRMSLYYNLLIIVNITLLNTLLQYFVISSTTSKDTLTLEEKLVNKCKEKGLTEQATKRLIMRYIEHKSIEEIASIECVEKSSISISLMRSRKRLKV